MIDGFDYTHPSWSRSPGISTKNSTHPHLRDHISEAVLKKKCPKLYAYFSQFREALKARKSFAGKMERGGYPFYAMYGAQSMESKYKVIWNRMGSSVNAVVVHPAKDEFLNQVAPIPQETLIFVPFEHNAPAHYLCALLNSGLASEAARRYSLEGSKSFASVHLLENIKIPRYDEKNAIHKALAQLSRECHKVARSKKPSDLDERKREIDGLAAKLWGLSHSELKTIADAIEKPANGA